MASTVDTLRSLRGQQLEFERSTMVCTTPDWRGGGPKFMTRGNRDTPSQKCSPLPELQRHAGCGEQAESNGAGDANTHQTNTTKLKGAAMNWKFVYVAQMVKPALQTSTEDPPGACCAAR
jgi:hypothetical protein